MSCAPTVAVISLSVLAALVVSSPAQAFLNVAIAIPL